MSPESSVDAKLGIGETVLLGSHTFEAEEIKRFARQFDPQPFHLSEEAARNSVFGRLCASGWHTISIWMRHNVASFEQAVERSRAYGEPLVFGPAAGLKDLQWLKPVYVGETIDFMRTPESHRALASRPGWRLLTSRCEAATSDGVPVMRFSVNVLVKA